MTKKLNTPSIPEQEPEQEEVVKRTPKEYAQSVAKAVADFNKVRAAVPLIEKFWWFKKDIYSKYGQEDVLNSICDRYDVSVDFVKTVGDWSELPSIKAAEKAKAMELEKIKEKNKEKTRDRFSDFDPDFDSIG